MGTYTLGLPDVGRHDVDLAGGKGAGLGELTRREFPVPAGFVVTTHAYADFMAAAGLDNCGPAQLPARISAARLPDEIAAAVVSAYRDLGVARVAVRSSATTEDLVDVSFAGQHDTFLDVQGEQAVLAAVLGCWASLWTPRAAEYRRQQGRNGRDAAMAVVVQVLVEAEWSGVMFTADPVTGQRDRTVIEAVPGFGDALVSGEVSGHRSVVDKATGAVLARDCPMPAGVLDNLATIGYCVEEAFGCPQDIEWTYADERSWLLQARPITALPDETELWGAATGSSSKPKEKLKRPKPGRQAKRRLLAAEHAPVPPYPLDCSLFLRPAVQAALQAVRSAGFATPDVADVVVGIEEGAIRIAPPRIKPTPRAIVGVPARLPRVVKAVLVARPANWLERCRGTLLPLAQQIDGEDLTELSDADLLDRMTTLRRALGPLLPGRWACFPRGRIADRAMRVVLRLQTGPDRAKQLHADLLSGVPSVTFEANQELYRLAATVRASACLRRIYHEQAATDIADRLRASAEGEAFLAEVDAYLSRFGYWKLSTPSVGLPPLREVPNVVHAQIKGLSLESGGHGDGSNGQLRAARAQAELRGPGLRRRAFGRLAARLSDAARDFVGFREDSHFYIFMVFAVTRRLVLELGRRLAGRGILEHAGDIVYLELSEIQTLPPEAVRETVRRRTDARQAAMPDYLAIPNMLAQRANTAQRLQGIPASRGKAVGLVRIIRDESQFAKLSRGDVLVCPYTNPSWTPLFSLAGAVVVDAGGAMSHSAIVAREYGIPAVMGTGNGTRLLLDGQSVQVDGETGTVVLVRD